MLRATKIIDIHHENSLIGFDMLGNEIQLTYAINDYQMLPLLIIANDNKMIKSFDNLIELTNYIDDFETMELLTNRLRKNANKLTLQEREL